MSAFGCIVEWWVMMSNLLLFSRNSEALSLMNSALSSSNALLQTDRECFSHAAVISLSISAKPVILVYWYSAEAVVLDERQK